jgi:hypothetical protein
MWVETGSLSFTARHEASQSDDALALLEDLEGYRERLERLLGRAPANVTFVFHDSPLQLALAQPFVAIARRLSAPEARRYMVGWFSNSEVHTLAPETLRRLAAGEESLRALSLAPHRAYTLLAVGTTSSALPPPFSPRALWSLRDSAWLLEGAAAWLSGQLAHLRAPLARRLRRGRADLPLAFRDAWLLGGTVFDLLAGERGEPASIELALTSHPWEGRALIEAAFDRPLRDTRTRWEAHLERLARASPAGTGTLS